MPDLGRNKTCRCYVNGKGYKIIVKIKFMEDGNDILIRDTWQ